MIVSRVLPGSQGTFQKASIANAACNSTCLSAPAVRGRGSINLPEE